MSKRILVVEDQEDLRAILRDFLSASGYIVIEAVDGAESVAKAASERPDLVITSNPDPAMGICGSPRRRSKSRYCAPRPRTEPVTVKIPRAENPGLIAALERWIAVAGIAAGEPLFRSIKKGGDVDHIRGRLKSAGVNVVLKIRIARYLQSCGYTPEAALAEAEKYSGHSGRVGMYTAAVQHSMLR